MEPIAAGQPWSATTKLEKLRSALPTPFRPATERVVQFRRRRHAISRSLSETGDPRIDPPSLARTQGLDLADGQWAPQRLTPPNAAGAGAWRPSPNRPLKPNIVHAGTRLIHVVRRW
jgi:hypothetical protein